MNDSEDKNLLIHDIQACGFFSSLPEEKIRDLLPFFARTSVNMGAILFYQGEASDYVYILVSGQLESYLIKSSGQTETLGVINPGETVGELGALSGELRSLTVEGVAKSELIRLPSKLFREICIEYPYVLAEISKFIIHRSLQTIQFIGKEKKILNISIVMPLFQNDRTQWVEKLAQFLIRFSNVYIEREQVKNLMSKVKQYQNAGLENKKIFLFTNDWDDEFFNFYKGNINLYLVFNEEEKKIPLALLEKINDVTKKILDLRIELILLHDERTTIANTRRWLSLTKFALHHHVRKNNDRDFRRLTRFMSGHACGLVLGGGGGKGLAHLGVIKALLDKKIEIDAIGGSSVGAGIGACYAFTMNYAQTQMFVEKLKRAGLKSLSWNHLTWPIISLYSSNPGTKTIYDVFHNSAIEDLLIPYFAVSSDLTDKKEFVHIEGLIWEAVRASTALPGVFPPAVLHGHLHYDGGMLNNLPVDVMQRRIGQDNKVIAVSLTRPRDPKEMYRFPPVVRIRDVAFSRFRNTKYIFPPFFQTFLESLLLGSFTKEISNAKDADVIIRPRLKGFRTISLTIKNETELIQRGYEEALTAIEHFEIERDADKK